MLAKPAVSAFSYKIPLSVYIEKNQRNLDENIHGGFLSIATAQPLNSGAPINATIGISRVFLLLNAGSDFTGTITITGTSVDRDTGAETGSDTEDIPVDALTTDNSDTDANGNTRHKIVGGYLSSKWWKGAIVISTTDVTLTDVDVWQISYEQVDDEAALELNTFDLKYKITNTAAWLNSYLYTVELISGRKATISIVAEIELTAADSEVNTLYRQRKSNLNKIINGSCDGLWVENFFGPAAQSYFEDVSIKVWVIVTRGKPRR